MSDLKWWQKPRQWIDGRYNYGDLVPVECPDCGSRVLYNGNYFCEDWGSDNVNSDGTRYGGPCNWALAYPATKRKDRRFCDAIGIPYN